MNAIEYKFMHNKMKIMIIKYVKEIYFFSIKLLGLHMIKFGFVYQSLVFKPK